MTDLYAVIGNPIAQSKSPAIHSGFALSMAQDLLYSKIQADPGGFAAAAEAFVAAGGKGMNVTAPFKIDAYHYATDLSDGARLAGAVNALKFEGGKVYAENFDGIGLARDIVDNLGCAIAGKRVLMLGAGGATRGAVLPFLAHQPGQLVIANRDIDKARAIVGQHGRQAVLSACGYADLAGQQFDLVLNATSSSLSAELPPIDGSIFMPGGLAYDLSYGKGLTPFLQLAKAAGVLRLADGVGMLVEQAAEAFAWWRGVRPATAAMIATLTVPLV